MQQLRIINNSSQLNMFRALFCTQVVAGRWPATSWVIYTTSRNTQSSVPEDG